MEPAWWAPRTSQYLRFKIYPSTFPIFDIQHLNSVSMHRSIYILIALAWVFPRAMAQQHHFFYIQSDKEQPFYVKLGDKTYSSTAAGFLILSKLKDTAIDIVVGFPKDVYPEYRFLVTGTDKDRGVALKDFKDKGWGLFDFQSLEVQMGEKTSAAAGPAKAIIKTAATDSFATILASVVDDSTLLESGVVRKENVPADPQKSISAAVPKSPGSIGADSLSATAKPLLGEPNMEKTIPVSVMDTTMASIQPAPAEPSILKTQQPEPPPDTARLSMSPAVKLQESVDSTGTQMVYVDRKPGGGQDTISVWLPSTDAGQSPPDRQNEIKDTAHAAFRPNRVDCRGMISVSELGVLRRRMETAPDEDAKVAAAVREFKAKCFTTEQVRSLLVVFSREEGRYKLIGAAYPYIYDPGNYGQLLPILKDPYFIHRFKKLTGSAAGSAL